MPTKQEELDAIREVRNGGAAQVTFKGNQVQYRSIEELLTLERILEEEIAAEAGTPKSRLVHLNSHKGMCK